MTSIRDELNICSVTVQTSTSATTPSKAPTSVPTSGTSKDPTQATTTTDGGYICTTSCKLLIK